MEHLQLILRLLCAYRSVAPANMRDHVLDFAGLLEGTRTACSSCDQPERLAELQVDLLELLSGSDAHQIAWMKEVGGAIYWIFACSQDLVLYSFRQRCIVIVVKIFVVNEWKCEKGWLKVKK